MLELNQEKGRYTITLHQTFLLETKRCPGTQGEPVMAFFILWPSGKTFIWFLGRRTSPSSRQLRWRPQELGTAAQTPSPAPYPLVHEF